MNVRYRVELSQAERDELTSMLSGGKHAARKLKRAQILLAADIGSRNEEIARTVRVSASTVYRTKRRFVEGNLDRALSEEPRPGAERKLTGKEEALLVATACARPPAGRRRWTLALLADAMVNLTDHDCLSGETVRRRLAENDLKPWRRDMWCVPHVDGEYVARMEDVLDLYAEAPDPGRPLVCFDETPVQLIGEVRQPIPPRPGKRERYDYECRRNGTVNLFVASSSYGISKRFGFPNPPIGKFLSASPIFLIDTTTRKLGDWKSESYYPTAWKRSVSVWQGEDVPHITKFTKNVASDLARIDFREKLIQAVLLFQEGA